jgi:hypothetical protein
MGVLFFTGCQTRYLTRTIYFAALCVRIAPDIHLACVAGEGISITVGGMNMRNRLIVKIWMSLLALILLVSASGCGGTAESATSLPVYPGAVELKPGEDPVADTLAKNMEQDASIRQNFGVGGKIEQKAFRLPADGSWEAVRGYYDKELKAGGWKSGMGGIGGDIANQALETANQANPMLKMAAWSKGKQILTIFRLMETPDATQAYLIISLNSN